MTFIFLVAYHLLFVMYSYLPYVAFIFYLYSFFFHSPRWRFVLQIEISGKYNSPLSFCFLSLFFSITLPAVRISLKFFKCGTQDFSDPGLLKIRRTLTGLSLWICLHKCFCNIDSLGSALPRRRLCVVGRLGRKEKRARGARWEGDDSWLPPFPSFHRPPRAFFFFFFFRLLLFLQGYPAGASAEER